MDRLVINESEKITVGDLKAFLSKFDENTEITLPTKCREIDIMMVGAFGEDSFSSHLMIAPRD